jgi:MFS family permease
MRAATGLSGPLAIVVGESVSRITAGVASLVSTAYTSRGGQLLLLALASFATWYSAYTLYPVQEELRIAMSFSDNQIALLQGPAEAFPILIVAGPLGLLIDRYSRVRLMLVIAVLELIATLLTSLASSFAMLFVARAIVGLAVASSMPVSSSLLADWYPPSQRGRASIALGLACIGGTSTAFSLGGLLVARAASAPDAWRLSLLQGTIPLVVITILILAMRDPPRTQFAIENPPISKSLAGFWKCRTFLIPILAGLVMQQIASNVVQVWSFPTFSRLFGQPASYIGAMMAMSSMVSGALGFIAGGFLADFSQRSGGSRRTMGMVSLLAVVSVPASLYALMPSFLGASTLMTLFMTMITATGVVTGTLLLNLIPDEIRGFCMSVTTAALVLIGNLGPLIASSLIPLVGGLAKIGTASTWVCAASSLLAMLVFTSLWRRFRTTR